jgi:aldehyde dehydrogenase
VSLEPRYENFIGGRWVAPVSGQYMTNVSPVTGKPFREVAKSTGADVELALDAAHAAKVAWGDTSLADRAAVLNRIADALEANRVDAVQRAIAHRTVHNTLLDPPAVRIRAGVSTPV